MNTCQKDRYFLNLTLNYILYIKTIYEFFYNFTTNSFYSICYFYSAATICKRDSVDYSACLKQALEEAFPRFVKGIFIKNL